MDAQWKFPDNGYLKTNGFATGDMETFMKDPLSSFAREICQNSIDARSSDKPTRVEFSVFDIDREEIKGIEDLSKQIDACRRFVKENNKTKELPTAKLIDDTIKRKKIRCIRVSDFNTTGLWGVKDNEYGTAFFNLTRGSGESDKEGSSGGSKGIGKFASFVISNTNTVFYSTHAKNPSTGEVEDGYIGISKLRSTPIEGKPRLYTFGEGYYGVGEALDPIPEQLFLDKSFSRGDADFGTDVYIIGFSDDQNWEYDTIAKILDSFMAAIVYGTLEVEVGGITVNKDTVKDVLYSEEFSKKRSKASVRDVKAQYELLAGNEDSVHRKTVPIDGSDVTIMVKQYDSQNKDCGTSKCELIRFPYMKITHKPHQTISPYSAVCVISDSELNKTLRNIENPQHTDWEINRLKDQPDLKKKTRDLRTKLEDEIIKFIKEVLRDGTGKQTDFEGAGDYLPSQDEPGKEKQEEEKAPEETVVVTPPKRQKPTTAKTEKSGENGDGYDFDKGEETDEGEEQGRKPHDPNPEPGPNPPEPHPGPRPDDPHVGPGETPVLKRVALSGMRYRSMVVDKNEGRYDYSFTSLYTDEQCDFAIQVRGEAQDKFPIDIISATINGQECIVTNGKITDLKIEQGKHYVISAKLDTNQLIASEVVMNAYR